MKLSNTKKKPKRGAIRALVLFSGGLDSILAAKILEQQGVEVTALTFESYFFDAGQSIESAEENNLKIKIADFSKKHFEIIKNPCFGYGVGMNPCIDCHLLMLKESKKIMQREDYDFIATGEVLGQRPMSQNREALKLIEKKSGLVGKILRPLSAKALPETEMEKSGLALREKLFSITGRGRKEQIGLAKKYKIKNFPTPAGGCILTDKEYSQKLTDLIDKIKIIKKSDLELLRVGRHFWSGSTRIILGRNHEENLKLKKIVEKGLPAKDLSTAGDTLVEPKNFPGPTALIRGKEKKAGMKLAQEKILKYAKKTESQKREFVILA